MTALSPLGLAALELARECGFAVLPLHQSDAGRCSCDLGTACEHPGKHPRTAGAYKSATTHPEQIAEWWDRWPRANIGLYPGASALLVLDVDSRDGERIARSLGAFDADTLETVTRRGVHRYFRLPDGVTFSNRSPWPDLDVRAHGGYVLAPPSVHPSGHVYRWRGDFDAVADAPEAVLAALRPPPARAYTLPPAMLDTPDDRAERRVLAYADRVGYGLSDGRKTSAYRFAAFMAHNVGLGESAALAYLSTWNAYNAPPLSAQLLDTIHTNARRYGGHTLRASA